jgi:hypothetical protein
MLSPDHRTKICNALHGAILDQLTQALADHPLDELADSLVYWEAFIQPRTNVSTTEARPNRKLVSVRHLVITRAPFSFRPPSQFERTGDRVHD